VILPLHTTHYPMLQRNLLYTAITRARRLLVLAGTKKALAIAVRNDATLRRASRLADRLAGIEGLARLPLTAPEVAG
jgi:exodeoxyribonuclease V alpha subunit